MSEHGPSEQWGPAYGGTPGYGTPSGYGPPGYGTPRYGTAPGYDAGYGYTTGQPAPAYGTQHAQPYEPYGYGPPPSWGAPLTWPRGPGRPGVTTAAAVLGFVGAGLTALASLGFLIAVTQEGDATMGVLALGLPCAAGQLYGAVLLLGRRSPTPLFASALAAVGVLLLALVVSASGIDGTDPFGIAFFVLLAGVLPVLTAVFARLPATLGWARSGPPR